MSIKDIEGECTDDDDFFIEVAMKICNYKNVGYHLKVPEWKLKSLSKKRTDSEQKIGVLWAWKRNLGSKATYFVLVRAFLDMSSPLIAECIIEYAKYAFKVSQRKPSQITPAKCSPNWDKLSDSDKDKLINNLAEENECVRITFASLIYQLCNSFASRNVNLVDVLLIAKKKYGIREVKEDRSTDTLAVFLALSKHSSWFNYQLFLAIVESKGNQTEKKLLKQYQEMTLLPYLEHCIFEIPSQSFSPSYVYSSSQSCRISLILRGIDQSLLSGRKVEDIRRNLAKLLDLDIVNFHFLSYQGGCFELFFAVNNAAFDPLQFNSFLDWKSSKSIYQITADFASIL